MEMCKSYIPTVKVAAWKFPKFHELLHIVDDIERFGAPMNFCAQRQSPSVSQWPKNLGVAPKNGNKG
jgi:hypothetical protein